MSATPETLALLALRLTRGLGPVTLNRLVEATGSPSAALGATMATLESLPRVGKARARDIHADLRSAGDRAEREAERAAAMGVRLIGLTDGAYPTLLRTIADPPPVLYVRGRLDAWVGGTVAIVGSRRCSAYGLEQAERFGDALARSGLIVISGGARGIDTAAHRGALRARGATIAVLGCGLAHCYPPDNAPLFDRIAEGDHEEALGAVVSELPLDAPPNAENFPARNRLISGLSLGTLVIEAATRSGALITARLAAGEHHREVMALPGRVDRAESAGSNELIKSGGAAMVTEPADVVSHLEPLLHHLHRGSFEPRQAGGVWRQGPEEAEAAESDPVAPRIEARSPTQAQVLSALSEPGSLDDVVARTGLAAGRVQAELTMLEIGGLIRREGHRFETIRR